MLLAGDFCSDQWVGDTESARAHEVQEGTLQRRQQHLVCVIFQYLIFAALPLGALFAWNSFSEWFAALHVHFCSN